MGSTRERPPQRYWQPRRFRPTTPGRRPGKWAAYSLAALVILASLACGPLERLTPTRGADTPPPRSPAPPTAAPTDTPLRPTRPPGDCLPDATYVADVTIVDGTEMMPGESFQKVWRVRSSGCAPWPPGTRLVFVSGDGMGAPESVPVPRTAQGSTADIAVDLQAPSTPGTYAGYFRMQMGDGVPFGDRISVQIIVLGDATVSFTADRYGISQGECVTIAWQTEKALAVEYKGQAVSDAGSSLECPMATTTYALAVQHATGEWERWTVTVVVQIPYY